jgi:hypothetical protein
LSEEGSGDPTEDGVGRVLSRLGAAPRAGTSLIA